MPAKRNVYTFKLMMSSQSDPKSPVTASVVRDTVKQLAGLPVYTIKSFENGEIEYSKVPVGEVVSISTSENGLDTLALVALDANLNPTQFVLEPHYAVTDEKAWPERLVITPFNQSFVYFMLLDEDADKAPIEAPESEV